MNQPGGGLGALGLRLGLLASAVVAASKTAEVLQGKTNQVQVIGFRGLYELPA